MRRLKRSASMSGEGRAAEGAESRRAVPYWNGLEACRLGLMGLRLRWPDGGSGSDWRWNEGQKKMKMMMRGSSSCILALLLACGIESCEGRRQMGAIYETEVIRLESGDSVRILTSSGVALKDGRHGQLIEFYPFIGLEDTLRLKRVARELWPHVYSALDLTEIQFVALRATTRASNPTIGATTFKWYGVVAERDGNGRWRLAGDSLPLRY